MKKLNSKLFEGFDLNRTQIASLSGGDHSNPPSTGSGDGKTDLKGGGTDWDTAIIIKGPIITFPGGF
jgi:hypothetical protein